MTDLVGDWLRATPAPPTLIVAAHPDDETLGAGAQLGRCDRLTLVHLTDGAPRDPWFHRQAGVATRADYARLRAAELETALEAAGAPRVHPGPYLNEFAVRVPDAVAVHRRLLDRGVLAGVPLATLEPGDPTVADGLLVCATEMTTPEEIGRFAAALADELGSAGEGSLRTDAGEAAVNRRIEVATR